MPTRLLIAYTLIALLVAGSAAIVWWNVHHARDRTNARRNARARKAAAARMASTDQGDDGG
jgi:hypothetical protein